MPAEAVKGSEDAMLQLTELEAELAELRGAYEQYFMGNERVPPLKKHEQFKKHYMRLKGAQVRQTAVKFRLESIGQKLLTYERLWERTLKEIENGTFKRDLARVQRNQKALANRKSADADFDVDEDLDISDLDEADDLDAAIAAAEKSVTAAPKIAPAVAPAIAAVKPVTGVVPAIAPMTPANGVKPAASTTGVAPAIAPMKPSTTGSVPAIKPVTGSTPAFVPTTPSSGVKPAAPAVAGLKPVTNPFAPAVAPAGPPKITSGSFPATARPAVTTPPQAKPAVPAVAAARPAAPVAGRAPASDGGLSEQKIKAIYDAYVMAKKRCGEDTRALTLDSVASSLKKQVPELMKQHNARSVEFKVVIKDGKAVLRALPKDG